MRQGLERPLQLDAESISLTVTIGIAAGDTAATSDELLAHADAAVRSGKAQGGSCHAVFDESMRPG